MSNSGKSFETSAPSKNLDRVTGSLKRAFPLPESGRFDDLLKALGLPDDRTGN